MTPETDFTQVENLAGDMLEQLIDQDGVPIADQRTLLYAALNVALYILEQWVPPDRKAEYCDEVRRDLNEIISAVLTPDSAFEARKRRSHLKLVISDPGAPR